MAPKWNDEEKQWVGAGLCVAWMKSERCKRGRKCAYKHLTCHNISTLKECDLYQTCIIKRIEQKRLLLQSQLQAEPETYAEADSGWNSLPCHLCSEIISIIAGTRDKHSFQSLLQAGSILREQASAFIKRLEIRSPLNSFDFLPRLAKPTNLFIRSSAQMAEDDKSRNNGRKIVHVLPKQLRETMTSERLAYLSHVEQVTVEVNERSDRDIIVDLDSFLNPLKLICPSVKDLVLSGSDSITLTDDFLLCGWGDDLDDGGIQSLTIEHSEICVSDREDGLYELRDYLDVFESLSSLYLPAQTMYLDDLQSLAALKSLKKLCVSSFHFEDSDKVPDQLFDGVAAPWTELQLCHNGIELSQLSLLPLSLDIHLILKTSPSTTFYWKMTQHDPEEGFDIFIGKQTIDSVVKLLSRASFFSVHGRPRYDAAEPYVRTSSISAEAFIESPKIPHLNLRTSSDMSTEDPADFLDMMAALSPLGLSCGLTRLTILCVPLLPSFFDSFVLSLPFIEVLTIHADANGEAVIEDPFPPLKAHPSLRELNLNEDLSGETLLSVGLQNFRLSVPHMMVSDAGHQDDDESHSDEEIWGLDD